MFARKQFLLHLVAELEACFSKPGSQLHWRRRELRSFRVRFGEELWIGRHLHILRFGNLELGERAALGHYVQLVNHAPIKIGDDFTGASNLVIDSGTHDPLTLVPITKEVRIGNRVWCGTRVTILAGVTIGDDVVIGAGSVVNHDIPGNSVAAGVPARVVRTLDRSELDEIWSWAKAGRTRLRPA